MSRKDACYYSTKARFAVWPSALGSMALAKCRKKHGGKVRKTGAGAAMKRWVKEKWVNTKTGKPCGRGEDHTAYCRPSKKVNSHTPVLRGGKLDRKMQKLKRSGQRAANRHR